MSRSSREEVRATTGMLRVRGSALISRRTWMPSTSGSLRSRRMTLGMSSIERSAWAPRQKTKSSASTPSRAWWTLLATLCRRKEWRASSASSGLSSTRRISTSFRMNLSCADGKEERRADVGSRFRPDLAPVAVDDALDDREPDAGAFELFRAVKALEDAEQLVRITHVEAGAVVTHIIHGSRGCLRRRGGEVDGGAGIAHRGRGGRLGLPGIEGAYFDRGDLAELREFER